MDEPPQPPFLTRSELGRHRLTPLRRVIDGLFTFVGICDVGGHVLEANQAAHTLLGATLTEHLADPIWAMPWFTGDGHTQALLREAIDAGAQGRSSRFDLDLRLGPHLVYALDAQVTPLVDEDGVEALVVSALDVSAGRRRLAQLTALAALAQELSASPTSHDVARSITEVGLAALDARYASVSMLEDGAPGVLHVVQPRSLPEHLVAEYGGRMSVERPLPLADCARTGEPILLATEAHANARYPHLAQERRQAGVVASAALPLRRGDGTLLGALGVGWDHEREFDEEQLAVLTTVAELCAQALERAKRADAEHELTRALQQQLLPELPAVRGLDISVAYLPASTGLGFGGDWYDVMHLDGHRTAFVVGDVVGHGVAAAARMAEVRSVVSALIRMGVPLDELLERATPLLAHLDHVLVATLAVVVVDTTAGTATTVLAGHPPPLVRWADGSVTALDSARHPPLGAGWVSGAASTTAFPPGATLVLYTDGLVERRGEPIDHAIRRLADVVMASPRGSADELRLAILEATGPAERTDDVAVAVVRHVAQPGDTAPTARSAR